MGKTNTKPKKNFSYDYDESKESKKNKVEYSKKKFKQIDNLLRSKNVNRLLDYSDDNFKEI